MPKISSTAPMNRLRAKRPLIYISSSAEEGEEEEDDDDDEEELEEEEEEEEEEEVDDDELESSGEDEDTDYEVENDNEEEEIQQILGDTEKERPRVVVLSDMEYADEEGEELQDKSFNNSAIYRLHEGNVSETLTLPQCKAYLRKHRLLVSGTKDICLQRIKEHLRLKAGNGEAFFPRSSFVINCTGDVCKGDVVLFKQKVLIKGRPPGKRTIAGRVVKESYGADKQQHTFTVEVLWSFGTRRLFPLAPLLVKGRNLYRMKTFRQLWKNEAERSIVLAEKHQRGAAARLVMNEMKMKRKSRAARKGVTGCHKKPSRTKYAEDKILKRQKKGHKNTQRVKLNLHKRQKMSRKNPCEPHPKAPRAVKNAAESWESGSLHAPLASYLVPRFPDHHYHDIYANQHPRLAHADFNHMNPGPFPPSARPFFGPSFKAEFP